MSDTNEERLLSDLLRDIGQEDACLEASPDLESTLMAQWERKRGRVPFFEKSKKAPDPFFALAIAAAILLAIAISFRAPRENPAAKAGDIVDRKRPVVIAEMPAEPRPSDNIAPPLRRAAGRRSPMTRQLVVDFIPLGPLPPAELSGSFQIVPVRIDNTPAHLVLGEDGIAQGILWRSR